MLILWVFVFASSDGNNVSSDNIRFIDSSIKSAVQQSLSISTDQFEREILARMTELDLRGKGIEHIDDLKHFTNLETLDLRNNDIENIDILAKLIHLKALNLRENRIVDISALASLQALEDLNIRHNHIERLDGLEHLDQLRKRLYIEGNPLLDYRAVSAYFYDIEDRDLDLLPLTASEHGGFYGSELDVELYHNLSESVIYYTLDGTIPTEESQRYEQPITVSSRAGEANQLADIRTSPLARWQAPSEAFKGTVLRATEYRQGQPVSAMLTQTYFVDEAKANRYELPVFSITTEPNHLFDYETGIYVPGGHYERLGDNDLTNPGNYTQRGREWERPGHVAFYESDGTLAFAQDVGLRIHGGVSRVYPQKTLRLYARNEYGNSTIDYQIFPDKDKDSYKRLILRNSGQDWLRTMFADALMQSLLKDMIVDTQAYRPSIVFINGEYWGIHNIRERYDKHYLERNYGVDRENVDLLVNEREVSEGDTDHYDDMIAYIEQNGVQDDADFKHIQTMMDTDNFIDYQIANIYLKNMDWPGNNTRYWRLRKDDYDPHADEGHDGRWRWLVFDTDFGFGYQEGPQTYAFDSLAFATQVGGNSCPNPDWSTFLLRSLLENDTFRQQFINRFADLLNMSFEPERVLQQIDVMQDDLEGSMEEHIQRWAHPISVNRWEENVDTFRLFGTERQRYVRQHLRDKFELSGMVNVRVKGWDGEQGTVKINSVVLDEQLDLAEQNTEKTIADDLIVWQGVYFEDVPITITAEPQPGYRFVGWGNEQLADEETVQLVLTDDIELAPVFERVQ